MDHNTSKEREQFQNALRLINKCEGMLHELNGQDAVDFLAIPTQIRIKAFRRLEQVKQEVEEVIYSSDHYERPVS